MELVNKEVLELLNNEDCILLEDKIAQRLKSKIDRNDFEVHYKLLETEVALSSIPPKYLLTFIFKNEERIINFSFFLLADSYPELIGIGISIKVAIYIIYLEERSKEELVTYIKKRRIPNAEKFAKKLREIYNKTVS